MNNRELAQKIVGNYFVAEYVREAMAEEIERALDDAEKRGYLAGSDDGWKIGKKAGAEEMRERASQSCRFIEDEETIRSLPISTDGVQEGEEK